MLRHPLGQWGAPRLEGGCLANVPPGAVWALPPGNSLPRGPGLRPACVLASSADRSFPKNAGPVFASHSLTDGPKYLKPSGLSR